MEIRNHSQSGSAPENAQLDHLDITRRNRVGIQKAIESIEQAKAARSQARATETEQGARSETENVDRVEISPAARQFAAEASDLETDREERRAERVVELKRAFEQGQLNTPERVERTARALLGGD